MSLQDSFLTDPVPFNVWIAARTDGISGSGTASDPFNGVTVRYPLPNISLYWDEISGDSRKARVTTSQPHGLQEGDVVEVSGVDGDSSGKWNGAFTIFGTTTVTFYYYMHKPAADPPLGKPACARLRFCFDEVMRNAPAKIKIHIGPGVFQTRGFAANDDRGWQPKTGQNIVGAGFDVTTLQLVGAENADQHYHVIGMPTEASGSTAITPLKHFVISDLTIDCNIDNQSGRPDPGYANVACGAVRILGDFCVVRNIKTINWGTKSLKQGCFVISILQASAKPNDGNGNPILTETRANVIEDCIAVQPSKNNARETTILHIGGVKNANNHAQGFGTGAVIRKNFVDCQFLSSVAEGEPTAFSSAFITSNAGTTINPVTNVGTFVGKRPHFRTGLDAGTFVRFYSPRNSLSRWNGYFKINLLAPFSERLAVTLGTAPPGTTDDSSFVVMGTEFRGIAVSSCICAVVEQNQIHNCWFGGPYASPLDDSVSEPSSLPTLAREERLDQLNALNIRSLTVRDNFYRNVAVGPYFNMGGVSGQVREVGWIYSAGSAALLMAQAQRNHLWVNARVLIEPDVLIGTPEFIAAAQASPLLGIHELISVDESLGTITPSASTFGISVNPNVIYPLVLLGHRVVSGTDFLVIEGNQIWLADLDETEFAIKEYPLAATASAQKYRPYGIIVADNELSPGYAHRQVFIRNNKINHVDTEIFPTPAGLGQPAGGGMLLAGIKQLHVTHNLVEVNARQPLRTFRCGTVRYFNNKKLDGTIVPGGIADGDGHYDEPETLAEDAFILSLLLKRRRR